MKKVLFLSGHLYNSKRQANFHHIASACVENGHNVTFCTVPNSFTTLLRQRHNYMERLKSFIYAIFPKVINNIEVSSYISVVYPYQKTTRLNKLIEYLFYHGYSKSINKPFDVIIFENGIPFLLYSKLKVINPNARFIYRVSDPVYKHKLVAFYEKKFINQFDIVSTPSASITQNLQDQYPEANIHTHYHAINKALFLKEYINPYTKFKSSSIHFVFVGASKLDYDFLKIASSLSENYIFHIVGPFEQKINKPNIQYYGELKFENTIPFIKYADICMQTLIKFPQCETFERTLKFTQYSFFKKPILSPEYMKINEINSFNYKLTNDSIDKAIKDGLDFKHENFDISWIRSWTEIADDLCNEFPL